MTRDEITRKQAEDYADMHGFRVPYDGSNNFYDETDVKASLEGFVAGANWADRTMIGKACEWLKDNIKDYLSCDGYSDAPGFKQYVSEDFYEDFKKAMEGGEE